jgi:hypothetical protein
MPASTTVYSKTPALGINLGNTAVSTPNHTLGQKVWGSDGHAYMYAKAIVAIGSITTCKISNAGSACVDSGSSGWTANVPSGTAANQYFWAKRTSIA